MRLESRPPLRKEATGTSATMCAATDSSSTARQVSARALGRSHGFLGGFPVASGAVGAVGPPFAPMIPVEA